MAQEAENDTARVFWSGRSQAVRLPKSYRFEVDEVRIRRRGSAVVLEPIADDWQWLDEVVATVDDDFLKMADEEPPAQERDVSGLFR